MSIELYVLLDKSKLPTLVDWQEEVDRIGFPLILHVPFDLRVDDGFRPATYRGEATGFEFYMGLSKDNENLSCNPDLDVHIEQRELCATFRWGGNLTEMSAAVAAAASLAKLCDGIYYYPEDDFLYGADEAVQTAKRELDLV